MIILAFGVGLFVGYVMGLDAVYTQESYETIAKAEYERAKNRKKETRLE